MTESRADLALALEREGQVLELRKAGMTFSQIAAAMNYADHTGPLKAYQSAMRKIVVEPAKQIRELEVQRLDTLWATWYPKAVAGNGAALDRCLRLMERRARLLGLDAPTNINFTVSLEQQQRIEEMAAQLGVLDASKLPEIVIEDDEGEATDEDLGDDGTGAMVTS